MKTIAITGGCVNPVINTQPDSSTINQGQSASLTVAATGAISYQWYNGSAGTVTSPVAGGTTNTITPSPASTTSYWVRITNACGFSDSVAATITVNACPIPVIVTQPAGAVIAAGATLTLTVNATGATSYQWYTGASGVTTSPVAGGTAASITVSPAVVTAYWVRVSNACGSANSNPALVNNGVGGVRGDANGNASVGVDDIFYLISFLFSNGPGPAGLADTNANGSIGVDDIFYLINYLFSGGPAPR